MARIGRHTAGLTDRALEALGEIARPHDLRARDRRQRSPLVAFNVAGIEPVRLAEALDRLGVESRAGLSLRDAGPPCARADPPASCRLSFALYNTATMSTARSRPSATSPDTPGSACRERSHRVREARACRISARVGFAATAVTVWLGLDRSRELGRATTDTRVRPVRAAGDHRPRRDGRDLSRLRHVSRSGRRAQAITDVAGGRSHLPGPLPCPGGPGREVV